MRQLIITKQITNREDKSVSLYFQEISKYAMISADEEVELTSRIRNGDMTALKKLVTANLRFVISVAKQYQNKGLSFPDLINEGNVGLVKAAYRFDETRGFKFISYAVWWIRQAIIQAISEQSRIVRLPLNRISAINRIASAMPLLEQEFQREPTDEEIAKLLDLTEEEVSISNKIKKNQVSFDAPLSADSEGEFNLYDVVKINNIPPPDENLLQESLQYNINKALNKLTKREAAIIQLSFGLNNTSPHSLREISHKHGITPERVRQIRQMGINKLRHSLSYKDDF